MNDNVHAFNNRAYNRPLLTVKYVALMSLITFQKSFISVDSN